MDLSAPDVETELVDLSEVPLAAVGSLASAGLSGAARRLLALVDSPPTLGAASNAGSGC
ncbi:hypothetical protein [Streptomyces sp. NPDC101165]|uniref:hypothetical protein n=1 Tax=Streptomyces sp. NPDC101165 TaxID=3366119 RepID=UPI0038040073